MVDNGGDQFSKTDEDFFVSREVLCQDLQIDEVFRQQETKIRLVLVVNEWRCENVELVGGHSVCLVLALKSG